MRFAYRKGDLKVKVFEPSSITLHLNIHFVHKAFNNFNLCCNSNKSETKHFCKIWSERCSNRCVQLWETCKEELLALAF